MNFLRQQATIHRLVILAFFSLFFGMVQASTPAPKTDVYNGGRGRSFNNDWKFYLGDVENAHGIEFNDDAWRKLSVPHDWSVELPFNEKSIAGGGAAYLDGGVGWYRKAFTLDKSYADQQITIQFEGVFMNSEVWVNGHYVGKRPFGYGSFEYDITEFVSIGATPNTIAVKVDNNQPTSRWYSGSGIYRNVWLTATNKVHVAYCGSFVTTPNIDNEKAEIQVETRIQNQHKKTQKMMLKTSILDRDGKEITSTTSELMAIESNKEQSITGKLSLNNPERWDIANPYLYQVKTEVIIKGKTVDTFNSSLGIRTFNYDASTGFWLNDKNTKLHGVCMHHDLGALGAAQNYRALERQVEILQSYGVNAIRTSHNPPAPELLEICNRRGVLVMVETFDVWEEGKNENDYNLYFNEWAAQDIQDVIRRDRNQPCVFMWCIGNEIPQQSSDRGFEIGKQLLEYIHRDDTTRPITQAFNAPSKIPSVLDVVGYNYKSGKDYDLLREANPDYVFVGTESASALRTRGVYHMPPSFTTRWDDMQCSSYDNSVVWWGHIAEESWSLDQVRQYITGQFIWTGFDYLGEPYPMAWPARSSYFGVVDMCGFPKDIYYFYQSQWTDEPMVHLLPHWNWLAGDTIPVWAYSNCDSISLSINGKALATQKVNTSQPFHSEWKIPFVAGTVKALAYKNGKVVAVDSIVTAYVARAISLKADRKTLRADGKDMLFIETDILDDQGNFVYNGDNRVYYSVKGPGKIVGVDNGNPLSTESLQASNIKAFNGKCLAMLQTTGAEGEIEITATSEPIKTNLALHKASKAASEYTQYYKNIAIDKISFSDTEEGKFSALKANDANDITKWRARDTMAGHWWMVDLQTKQQIKGVQIDWEGARAYKYKIEVSVDSIKWELAVDKSENALERKTMHDEFSASARYIRITITEAYEGNPVGFSEFKVFDGSAIMLPQQNFAQRGNDGDIHTVWLANDNISNHSWEVDLGKDLAVLGSEIVWQNPVTNFDYRIETSLDAKNWRMVADKNTGLRNKHYTQNTYKALARYVKVTILGDENSELKAGFAEFKVFNGEEKEVKPTTVTVQCVKN